MPESSEQHRSRCAHQHEDASSESSGSGSPPPPRSPFESCGPDSDSSEAAPPPPTSPPPRAAELPFVSRFAAAAAVFGAGPAAHDAAVAAPRPLPQECRDDSGGAAGAPAEQRSSRPAVQELSRRAPPAAAELPGRATAAPRPATAAPAAPSERCTPPKACQGDRGVETAADIGAIFDQDIDRLVQEHLVACHRERTEASRLAAKQSQYVGSIAGQVESLLRSQAWLWTRCLGCTADECVVPDAGLGCPAPKVDAQRATACAPPSLSRCMPGDGEACDCHGLPVPDLAAAPLASPQVAAAWASSAAAGDLPGRFRP